MSRRKPPPGRRYDLPEDWTPDALDPIDREEYDHMKAYGLTPTETVLRLGWSTDTLTRAWYRYNERTAS